MIDTVERYAPGFKASVIGRQALSPLDLEQIFGLIGGDIFHGALSLDQLFWARPMLGYADYRGPLPGLYHCGAGAHPGGGVTGAPGHNAARAILADRALAALAACLAAIAPPWHREQTAMAASPRRRRPNREETPCATDASADDRGPHPRHRGPARDLQSDRQPSAERRHRPRTTYIRSIFTDDAVLDLGGTKTASGNEAISEMSQRPEHQAAIKGGLAHFAGLPHVTHRRRPRRGHVLSADPRAASDRRDDRGAGARRVEGLSHPPRRRQSLGARAHARRAGRSSAAPIARSTAASPRSTSCGRRSRRRRQQPTVAGTSNAPHRSPRRLARLRHAGRQRDGRRPRELRHRAVAVPLPGRSVRAAARRRCSTSSPASSSRPAARSASAASRSPATAPTAASCFRISRSCFRGARRSATSPSGSR